MKTVCMVLLLCVVATYAKPAQRDSAKVYRAVRSLFNRHISHIKRLSPPGPVQPGELPPHGPYQPPGEYPGQLPHGHPGKPYQPGPPQGPNGIPGQGPPKGMMVAMTLMSRGCDDPSIGELMMALNKLVNSPLAEDARMPKAMQKSQPSMDEIAMISCVVTNIDSLQDLADLAEIDIDEMKDTYPMYVGMIEGFIQLFENERKNLDPVTDAEVIEGIDDLLQVHRILEEQGLFDLE